MNSGFVVIISEYFSITWRLCRNTYTSWQSLQGVIIMESKSANRKSNEQIPQTSRSLYWTPKTGPWCSPEMWDEIDLNHCQWWRHKQGFQRFSAAKATVTQRKQITVMETAVPTIMARKTPSGVLWILTFFSLVDWYFRIVWKVH